MSNVTIGGKAGALTTRLEKEFVFVAEGLTGVETNIAALEQLNGTTVKTKVRSFSDTTEQYANGKFIVPSDIDTSGTVTFQAYVMAKVAVANKNVALTFGHYAAADGETFDGAYTDEDSGDVAIDGTQDNLTLAEWTETVSNLGWAANDNVFFRVSRPAASADNLADDMYLFTFRIKIPRA